MTPPPRPGGRQTGIGEWVEGVPAIVHDCAFDVVYLRNGRTPPCKLPRSRPRWEPPR